jgi:hypothetical protein
MKNLLINYLEISKTEGKEREYFQQNIYIDFNQVCDLMAFEEEALDII